MNNNTIKSNGSSIESLICHLEDLSKNLSNDSFQKFMNYNSNDLSKEEDLKTQFESVKSKMETLNNKIKNFVSVVSDTYNKAKQTQNVINQSVSSGLPDSSSVGVSSSTASTSTSSSSDNSSSSSSSKSSEVSIDNKKKEVNKLNIEDLLVDMLAPFGVSKDNLDGVTKTDKGYTITLKNPNEDGKWKANDIKEYYITDGKVSGVLTGDDTYVKVEDGKLVIDKDSSKVYSGAFATAVGTSLSYFANKANYNTDSNKEIFKKFYPNATDEEFDSFCENISENGEKYSEIAEKAIDTYSDNIAEIAEKNGYNYLVVEDNKIQVDYTGVATELYAYESSKSGISFAEGINSEITFNDAVATDLAEYLKTNYSIDVDVNSIVNSSSETASTLGASDNTAGVVNNTSNVVNSTTNTSTSSLASTTSSSGSATTTNGSVN